MASHMSPDPVTSAIAISEGSGPVAGLDPAGRVEAWDPALQAVWGRPAEQAIGHKLPELLVPLEPNELPPLGQIRGAAPWSGIVALLPADGGAPRPSGLRLSRAAGSEGLELRLAPLSVLAADEPNADAAIEPVRDLQRFAGLLESMPGFCYTIDRELVFTSSSGKGLAALALQPGQVIGQNVRDLWGTHDASYEPLVCHLKALAGIPASYKDVWLGRSLEYSLRPLRDTAGAIIGAVGVAIDVTDCETARQEQVKLAAQLRQSQKMEALGRLAGGVAHDFNNLLTCIIGNLALLEEQVREGTEAAAAVRDATEAVESATSLTRQLLQFSRKQIISPRPISLSALVQRLAKLLERLVGDRIPLVIECQPDLWSVNADSGQMEQIVVNLVANARDAISKDGQIVVATRNVDLTETGAVVPESLHPGLYVALSVQDTGRGLSDVERSRLFEPFFTTKDVGEGTGLGLATVYGAVQQNGGAITVESALGKGTTFRILLPRVDSAPVADASATNARKSTGGIRGGTETILLVEDEPSVLDLAQRTLQHLGYNVLPCGGPDEALRTFDEYQNRVQLLVTDVVMPRMNGKDLAARITARAPGVAVLFTSGYGENIIAKQGVIDDGIHFIGKPYRPEDLARRVRSLLDIQAALPK